MTTSWQLTIRPRYLSGTLLARVGSLFTFGGEVSRILKKNRKTRNGARKFKKVTVMLDKRRGWTFVKHHGNKKQQLECTNWAETSLQVTMHCFSCLRRYTVTGVSKNLHFGWCLKNLFCGLCTKGKNYTKKYTFSNDTNRTVFTVTFAFFCTKGTVCMGLFTG